MDDNDAFEAKLEAEPEAGGGLEANDDYNEVEIDAEPRRLDINPDTVLAAAEQSIVQVQTCEQCLTMSRSRYCNILQLYLTIQYKYDSLLFFVKRTIELSNFAPLHIIFVSTSQTLLTCPHKGTCGNCCHRRGGGRDVNRLSSLC